MDNSSWMTLTNRLLRNSGLSEIPSTTAFDTPGQGLMTRYQSCAKEYIKISHEESSVDLPVNFARRRFQLPIDQNNSIYSLDAGMSVESITFDSFRNLTVNGGQTWGNLRNWTYEYFTSKYPDTGLIYSGAPTHYILLPVARTAISPLYQVRIFPNPDKAYSLEYIAQLNPYALNLSTDLVLWPPEYEHVLVNTARYSLEDILGEGKAGSVGMLAKMAYQKMRQKATASRAERKSVRVKKLFSRRGVFGYYDSPPDSDAPYNTPTGIR